MPYTLVHPAFVLPLKKWKDKWFSYEALIIGSFVPDFDIIFRFTENRFHIYTFTILNILTVIFPISILTYFFYVFFLKKVVVYLFELNNQDETINKDFIYYLKILCSLLIAIIVHIILDNLSHPDANKLIIWIQRHSALPLVSENLSLFCLYGPLVISSLFGGILLFHILFSCNENSLAYIKELFKGEKKYFWNLLFFIFQIIFWLKIKLNGLEKGFGIDSVLLFSLSGLFYGFIAASLLFRLIYKKSILGA